jgi:outer membrane protein assembly factor BamB
MRTPAQPQFLRAPLKSQIKHAMPLLLTAFVLLLPLAVRAGDWPAFRGPLGNGVAQEDNAPLHWGPGKNVLWKATLPALGNSSPIVSHGCVFITCAEHEGKKRNLYCFDRRTGKELWVRTAEFPTVEPTHQSNPYCGSTPVADGARVVVWHGSAGVFCYNFDGKELWKTDLGKVRNEWGYGSSPILHRGKVILNFGPGDRAFLAALDLKTGKLLWKFDEPGGPKTLLKGNWGSWCTPIVAKVGGKDQILCSMLTQVVACDPKTGARLWFCEGLAEPLADLVYPSPVVSGEIGVAFSGWANGPTFGFKLGGSGDVTASNRLWLVKQTQRVGSGVVVNGTCSSSTPDRGLLNAWSVRLEKSGGSSGSKAEKAGVRS